MADILEKFDLDLGGSGKKKKLNKKKLFTIAAIGVGVVALIFWFYKKENSGATSYVTSGMGGYPIAPSTEESGSELGDQLSEQENYFKDLIADQDTYYDNLLNQKDTEHATNIAAIGQQYESQIDSLYDTNAELQQNLTFSEIVGQMMKNSDMYLTTGDMNLRSQYAIENIKLAESIGATKNEAGEWFDSTGARLYQTPLQASGIDTKRSTVTYDNNIDYSAVVSNLIKSGANSQSSSVLDATVKRAAKISDNSSKLGNLSTSYDKNVDYSAAIATAKAQGASQSTIDTLNAQRNAKIKGENLNQDGSKKK